MCDGPWAPSKDGDQGGAEAAAADEPPQPPAAKGLHLAYSILGNVDPCHTQLM